MNDTQFLIVMSALAACFVAGMARVRVLLERQWAAEGTGLPPSSESTVPLRSSSTVSDDTTDVPTPPAGDIDTGALGVTALGQVATSTLPEAPVLEPVVALLSAVTNSSGDAAKRLTELAEQLARRLSEVGGVSVSASKSVLVRRQQQFDEAVRQIEEMMWRDPMRGIRQKSNWITMPVTSGWTLMYGRVEEPQLPRAVSALTHMGLAYDVYSNLDGVLLISREPTLVQGRVMVVLGRSGQTTEAGSRLEGRYPIHVESSGFVPRLSARQQAVLALVVEGLPVREIAAKLGMSESRTRQQISAVLRTLSKESSSPAEEEMPARSREATD